MMTLTRVQVTMVRTWAPGAPGDVEDHRIVFTAIIDAQAQPDVAAWLADPDPWPAERQAPGRPLRQGDVAHDEDGWSLRFPRDPTTDPDTSPHRIFTHDGGFRPGEVVTLHAPNGEDTAWRVVGIG